MSDNDTYDPAFPYRVDNDDGSYSQYHGMALRDYFAASIVAGLYASHGGNPPEPEQMAEAAYCIADAMLKEREK